MVGMHDTGSVFDGAPKVCMHSLACHRLAARGLIKASPWYACRAEAMRRELDASVDATCTFTPRLNTKATNKILFKSLSSSSTSGTSPTRDPSPEWPSLKSPPLGRYYSYALP